MRADYQTLLLERIDGHVLIVTLNRPEVANALNSAMGHELTALFEALLLDAEGLRAIVLTGRGEKAFCAGADLKERDGMSDADWQAQHLVFERMVRAMMMCPVPLIAAVNGAAYGAGCEIACLADFIYAAEDARFAFPEVTRGIMPGAGGTQHLARAVGERRAKEIILTGAPFTVGEAMAWGLVNRVFPRADLAAAASETALRIARNAPVAVRQAKQAIHRGLQMSIWDGLAYEVEAYARMVPTWDRREGVRAFNEKRAPDFKGE